VLPSTAPLMEATDPPAGEPVPLMGVLPPLVAVRVHWSAVAVPPPVLTTSFSSVSVGFWAVFVNVHVTFAPLATATVLFASVVPPVEHSSLVRSYPAS